MSTRKKSRNRHLSEQSYDLEKRLIAFAVDVLNLTDDLPNTLSGKHISNHLIRSSTSSALHYGEAESAESRKDFIHKMRVSLKELREVLIALEICRLKPLVSDLDKINSILSECNELIAIFVKSVETAENRVDAGRKKEL